MNRLLWLSLKRDKIHADLYHKGEKIASILVSEQNRYNNAVISLITNQDIKFKIVKHTPTVELDGENENTFNKEIYNK